MNDFQTNLCACIGPAPGQLKCPCALRYEAWRIEQERLKASSRNAFDKFENGKWVGESIEVSD